MITLIADDHFDSADAVALNFELAGITALSVTTTASALDAIELHKPDAGVLDLAGAELDGFEIASAFRASPIPAVRNATLVAYTGLQNPVYRMKALESGFDYLVLKPYDPETLIALCLGIANLSGPADFKVPEVDHVKFAALSERSIAAIAKAREIGALIRAMRKNL